MEGLLEEDEVREAGRVRRVSSYIIPFDREFRRIVIMSEKV